MKIFTFPTGPFFGYQRGVIIDLLVYMPCFVVLSIGCLGAQLVLIVGFRALSSRRSTRLWCKSTCAQETLMPKPEKMLKRFLFQTRASR